MSKLDYTYSYFRRVGAIGGIGGRDGLKALGIEYPKSKKFQEIHISF